MGDLLPIAMEVAGLKAPVMLQQALQVVGPRPAITGANASFPTNAALGLREGELPAGLPVSFAIGVKHLHPLARISHQR